MPNEPEPQCIATSYFSGVSGTSQSKSSRLFSGDEGDFPVRSGAAKGIADVAVNTGRSARRITDEGVAVLGGSHCSGGCCCWARGEAAGPSGWYGMNTSAASEVQRSRVGLRAGLREGLAAAGELDGSGILCGSTGARPKPGVDGLGSTSTPDNSAKCC